MVAVASTCDGGIPGFGAVGYIVCEDAVTQERISKIVCSKSKISKRTVLGNKALSRIIQTDLT